MSLTSSCDNPTAIRESSTTRNAVILWPSNSYVRTIPAAFIRWTCQNNNNQIYPKYPPVFNITVGYRLFSEQNANITVYWLLCTNVIAAQFTTIFPIILAKLKHKVLLICYISEEIYFTQLKHILYKLRFVELYFRILFNSDTQDAPPTQKKRVMFTCQNFQKCDCIPMSVTAP
jgi:hypothetical protein